MIKKKIVLIGSGGHARSCIQVIEELEEFSISGLIGLPNEVNSEQFGYKVIGSDSDLPTIRKTIEHAAITVGQISNPQIRINLFKKAEAAGFILPTIISKSAQISPHAVIGKGCMIMNDVIINSGAQIGQNCIINTRALIEHDVVVGDHCHVSTGVIVNGATRIGNNTFIGSGSIIRNGLVIGDNCLVGMGSVLVKNLKDNSRKIGS
jgi:sugar O-acyltransferase (sialic acid O-acetyltransferase NeuD family)